MINWNVIDTVLLDMDGTLLDLHFDNYFWTIHLPKRYAEHHAIELPLAQEALEKQINELRGSLQWYCLDHWSELLKLDIPGLKREIKHKIQVRPHVNEFLAGLGQLNKHRVLITNAHRRGLEIKLNETGIDTLLDEIISSHDYRSAKEHAPFWQELGKNIEFNPSRTIFIDDTVSVLEQAANQGIAYLVCMNQPDSQKPPQSSDQFIDICHFDEIMPTNVNPRKLL